MTVVPDPEGAFTTTSLVPGENLIEVMTTDNSEYMALVQETVILDTLPSSLSYSSPSDGDVLDTETEKLQGTTEHEVHLVINGVVVQVQ